MFGITFNRGKTPASAVKSISPADAETRSLADPADWLLEVFGIASPVASGVAVTPRTALSVPAVRAAVELIAGTLGTLPVSASPCPMSPPACST